MTVCEEAKKVEQIARGNENKGTRKHILINW